KAIIYNISDKSAPKQIRELELKGSYVSSRKIGTSLYMITNEYLNYHGMINEQNDIALPSYRDSINSNVLKSISYDDIRYFPNSVQPNYMLIGGVNLADHDQ